MERRRGAVTTISDVAARAGVGKGTVSRVLNGGIVSAATRLRVETAIAELGYRPSYAAQSLARGQLSAVAVVVPFVTHPSAVSRVQGIIEGLRPSGLPVSILDVETPEHAQLHFASLVTSVRPRGVIVVSLVPDATSRAPLDDTDVPIVWVDAEVEGHKCVYIDNVAGGAMATEHLLGLGHRDIAFIGDDDNDGFGFTSSSDRQRGFVISMERHGLDASRCRTGPHSKEVAERLAAELLDSKPRPTGIVASSDTQALGVLAAARRRGIRVPEELSVIGFDDIELAEIVGLSTIRQPIVESGRQAAALLLATLDRSPKVRRAVELPLQLIVRQSTGAAVHSAGAQPVTTTD